MKYSNNLHKVRKGKEGWQVVLASGVVLATFETKEQARHHAYILNHL